MAPHVASDDVLTKVSTEGECGNTGLQAQLLTSAASTNFVSDYYHALHSRRKNIATFYIPSSSMHGGKPIPTIVFNGNVMPNGQAVQEMFDKEMPPARYDAQLIDCHILNPQYAPSGVLVSQSAAGAMTLLISVSGTIRFGEDRNDHERQFSETFVLVPNHGRSSKNLKAKDFLIQSQNFRLVV